jgi:hypothetical protein
VRARRPGRYGIEARILHDEEFRIGHILVDHRAPAASLRAAQHAVRTDPRWSAPYYWAGFVIQGEWR